MRLTGGSRASAEDISQQSFLRSYQYLKSFEAQKSYKNWLTGITVNCFKDLHRKENRYEPFGEGTEPHDLPDFEGNKDFFLLIKLLSEEEKRLVILKYLYKYRNPGIGGLLNMNVGTVKSKLSRAMKKLR